MVEYRLAKARVAGSNPVSCFLSIIRVKQFWFCPFFKIFFILKTGGMIMVVTEYSLIGALLRFYPETIEDFKEMGMNCVGCPSSAKETIGQACNVHSVDVNELIKKLDKRING